MPLSFEQITDLVRTALRARCGEKAYCYIVELYPDSVVYCVEGDMALKPAGKAELYQQCSYSIMDGAVTLGEAQTVERRVEYVPLKAACRIQAAVDGDATGYKWRVKVIEFGQDKPGRIWWDKAVLTAALEKFEGARVFALQEAQHQAKPHPFGKSIRDLVGVLQNVAATDTAIEADLIILPAASWLRDNLVGCAEMGLNDVIGLSVDILGKGGTKKNGSKTLLTHTAVTDVTVDVVYNPAAGGQIMHMAAAVPAGHKEAEPMKEQLLAALKAARPQQYATINPETVTEQELITMLAAAPADDLDARIAAAVAAAVKPNGDGKALEEMKLVACAMTLDRELSASKLPEAAQDDIRARFEGQVFEPAQLQAAIKSTKEMIDRLTASGIVQGVGDVRITVDSREKVDTMLDDFFNGKLHSFKAAYVDITGDTRITGDLRDAKRLTAAIASTTFAEALGDAMTRRMVAEYNASGLDDWKKIVTVVPLQDFRTQHRPRIGGYGDLPAVNQSAAYAALTSPGDEESTYAPTKRGGTEDLTIEAIRNDDVGLIRRIPTKLSRAAARTLYKFVFDFLATNPTIYDTVALFHATHANLGAAALAKATLQAGRLAMIKQVEAGSSEQLGIPPKYLIVPADLEDTAFELTAAPAAGLFTPTAPDSVRRQTYETIVVKTWTDANNWYLCADPADIPTIEIGFLDGREEPELFVQDMPNVGSMFSNDKLTYKIRHIYGGAVQDYRGLYGAVVA